MWYGRDARLRMSSMTSTIHASIHSSRKTSWIRHTPRSFTTARSITNCTLRHSFYTDCLRLQVMCRYRHVWNIELRLRPAFLAGVVKGSGNKPPGLLPEKLLYMTKDLTRASQYFGVPMRARAEPYEATFQKGALSAMRFVAAVQEREKGGDKQVEQVSREFWKRIWSEDKDITEPASLSEAAMKAGLSDSEIKEVLEMSTSKAIKDKLKSSTQEALDHGGFGFPLVVCHVNGQPEMFFGSDRFELMAHCIGEKWLGPQPDKSAAKL